MELKFIPQRLTVIRRLRGLTIADIENNMKEISGRKNRLDIYKWEDGSASPNSFDKVRTLAQATSVPVGFYYYNNVQINMKDLDVEIWIIETGEKINFRFI